MITLVSPEISLVKTSNLGRQTSISFELLLKTADTAVFAHKARHLKNIEVAVLRGAWLGQRYEEIAKTIGYAPDYIKRDVGPKLWQILSASLGEKVTKTNFISVVAHKILYSQKSFLPSKTNRCDVNFGLEIDLHFLSPEQMEDINKRYGLNLLTIYGIFCTAESVFD